MQILTEFQEKLLKEVSLSPLRDSFFLTGGTALSAFYLKHRYSEDLDFFTTLPGEVRRIIPVFKEIVEKLSASIEIRRSFATFTEGVLVSKEGEIVIVHFAEDTPYRLKPTVFNEEYKIYVDNLIDIACNKFSALFDRHEMKDFVDIYFIDKEVMKFEEVYSQAKIKHIGMDDYWLCQALRYINELTVLPKMIKKVDLKELRDFFNQKIREIMLQIERGGTG
jgi:predicted nucleotidyltransferase component of viral defense system